MCDKEWKVIGLSSQCDDWNCSIFLWIDERNAGFLQFLMAVPQLFKFAAHKWDTFSIQNPFCKIFCLGRLCECKVTSFQSMYQSTRAMCERDRASRKKRWKNKNEIKNYVYVLYYGNERDRNFITYKCCSISLKIVMQV